MKTMFFAFAAAIVIAVAAWFALHELGFSSADAQTGAQVRLGETGSGDAE